MEHERLAEIADQQEDELQRLDRRTPTHAHTHTHTPTHTQAEAEDV
jgi:hypothetical protein